MQEFLNHWRDKARDFFYSFSQTFGETLSIKPDSIQQSSNGANSLKLDLPSLKSLLPYETYDAEGFFINRNSYGFGLHLMPMAGADESLMKSLAALFKNKLPKDVDCTVLLYKHPYLAQNLAQSYAPVLKQGGIYAELARLSLNYHFKAIKEGYPNNRNIPAQLADYCCYLFISRPIKGSSTTVMHQLRDDFESELKVAGFSYGRLEQDEFKTLLRAIISPSSDEITWPLIDKDEGLVSDAIPNPSTVYEIHNKSIDITHLNSENKEQKVRIINCQISKWPDKDSPFALWQTPDLFANLLRPEHGIACPFLISFTIRGANREKIKKKAKARAKDTNSSNNAVQNFLSPGLAEEAAQWNLVHQEIFKDNMDLFPTFYNLILFSSIEYEREHVAKAISSFRQHGFTLIQSYGTQWLRFLGSLPFVLTEGLFSQLEKMGLTKRLSNYNVANLLPVIADFKGSKEGLLLPTVRHQCFFYDPFDDKSLPISNYNRLTVASPGAGKSYLQQALILDGLARSQLIFVIDLGASYKHLCQLVGGTYIDATTLALNPFTLFDFDGVTEIEGEKVNDYIQIRDLLAIMASPHEALLEVQKAWLLEVVLSCWQTKGREASMDDVLYALEALLQKPESRNDRRLKDLLILLSKYGSEGIYGKLFNQQTSLLNGSNFVVLEMGGLESNPELLTIVMFVMIVIIQGQFYQTDRRIKKQCIIDEAWRFLASGSNPIAASFIEQGFRTARKHNGGFAVVTQNLLDTSKTVQGQAIAASSDTKIIMKQGAFKEFQEAHPKAFNPLQIKMIESFGEARLQGFSDLMLQFGNLFTFHRFFSDSFSRILFSSSGEEFGAIEALVAQGHSLVDAINQVARHHHGEGLCA